MEIKVDAPWIDGKLRCQNGYIYIDKAYWNTKKQRADHTRIYIGKHDGISFIPGKNYYRLEAEYARVNEEKNRESISMQKCERKFFGATYLLDAISEKIGLTQDLETCFPENYWEILSIAYFLVLEEEVAMYRFSKWSHTDYHPIPSANYPRFIKSETSLPLSFLEIKKL